MLDYNRPGVIRDPPFADAAIAMFSATTVVSAPPSRLLASRLQYRGGIDVVLVTPTNRNVFR